MHRKHYSSYENHTSLGIPGPIRRSSCRRTLVRPVLDLGDKQPAEFGRRAGQRAAAGVGDAILHHGGGEGRVDLGVEPISAGALFGAPIPVVAPAPNLAPSRRNSLVWCSLPVPFRAREGSASPMRWERWPRAAI